MRIYLLPGRFHLRERSLYRNCHCQASEAEIAQALTGTYRDEHLYALKQAYEAWRFYAKQRDEIDEQIQQQLARMKQDRNLPPLKPRKLVHGRKPNQPRFDVRTALVKERKLTKEIEQQLVAAIQSFQPQFKPPTGGRV